MPDKTPLAVRVVSFLDLGYTVKAEAHDYYVDYTVYQIDGVDGDKPLWHKKGAESTPSYVETLEEAEVFLNGSVKWDGCSNWSLDAMQKDVMMHSCDREGLVAVGEVMARCWDLTATLCPNWDD